MILTTILALAAVIAAIFLINEQNKKNEKTYTFHAHSPITVEPQLEGKEFESQITLGAVGDILIHNSVYEDAFTGDGYDFRPMLAPVKNALLSPDLTFANQETVLGGTELGLSSYPMFNSPYEVGDALKDAGVDIVSMANNHTLDAREEGIMNATAYLKKIGIEYVGAYRSLEDQNTPRIINRDGISVGFVAYTYGTNGLIRPEDKPYLVQYIEQDKIINDIKALRSQVDFIVVSLHFGLEYQRFENVVQRLLVEEVSKAGADIILGHHPHVLQPADWIIHDDGRKTFVIYSLGNFLSGQADTYQRIGAVLHLDLSKRIDSNNETHYDMFNAKIMPTWTYRPNYTNYKVIPLIDADKYDLPNAKDLFDEIASHMKSYSEEIKVFPEF
jgi:poly-gamma-glutamate capsule biosynthesis protein CapA/YwtB (metallophosphatase superfamily)